MSLNANAHVDIAPRPLRLGFLGTGWIGRQRLDAVRNEFQLEAVLCDPSATELEAAQKQVPEASTARDFSDLMTRELDGVVIATPSAMHAVQTIAALEQGFAVFCQKPLGRSAAEVEAIIAAARRNDRLLGVDMSYRFTRAAQEIYNMIEQGVLGHVHSVDLVFHNAYGPDKAWFYNPDQSGGGCVMDLGVHLIDLALWMLGFPDVHSVHSDLKQGGTPLAVTREKCEDVAFASFSLETGATVRLACSWRLHAGCDADISAAFYGTHGGAMMRNVGGSFYDFKAEHYIGTSCTPLVTPPDAWGGRAIVDWASRLSSSGRFDHAIVEHNAVARILDRIYQGC